MIDSKSVTVIIPHLGETKEQEYAFNECYASLRESTPEIRIVVAKNGGACIHPRDVRVVDQGQNKAVNAGIAITDTEWVMVSNDDMIYPPGWFEKLTEGMEDKMCVSPKLIEPRSGAPTFEVYFCGGAGGDFDKPKFFEFAKNHNGTGYRTGFNLPFLIKRELLDIISTYDINYDPWGSNGDSDLEYKIRLAGVQPYQNTDCIVYHFAETSGTSNPINRPYWQKNWDYFIAKWGFERASGNSIWQADFEIPEDKLIYRPWWKDFYKT